MKYEIKNNIHSGRELYEISKRINRKLSKQIFSLIFGYFYYLEDEILQEDLIESLKNLLIFYISSGFVTREEVLFLGVEEEVVILYLEGQNLIQKLEIEPDGIIDIYFSGDYYITINMEFLH